MEFPHWLEVAPWGTDKPQLKPATTGDIIDYYGPCDYDPLGKDEIESQIKLQEQREYESE